LLCNSDESNFYESARSELLPSHCELARLLSIELIALGSKTLIFRYFDLG
jgi:hypothetical protein